MYKLIIYLLLFLCSLSFYAQNPDRPFILVKEEDRGEILNKIENQVWAKETYIAFLENLDKDVALHQADRDKFLRGLPLNWEKAKSDVMPAFYLTYHVENGKQTNLDNVTQEEYSHAATLIRFLEIGVDSGVAYYLTKDVKYAQCATDILNAVVNAILQSEVSDWHHRGGLLFPYDGFREVRVIGEKIPVIYDFIAPFIENGGKAYDILQNDYVGFPVEKAQNVFRTYANLTINYGQTGNNHSALESPNLVFNALAIENPTEREELLSYFLEKSTDNQDPLNVMAGVYKNQGDLWPESSQYLNHVSNLLTRLIYIVNRYKPQLHLGKKYSNVFFSLPKLDFLVYPNDEIIRWGDGNRNGKPSYLNYEYAYNVGQMDGVETIIKKFGPLLNRAIEKGTYERNSIQSLLLPNLELPSSMEDFHLPRTDNVKHAGIFLQRNLSVTNKPENDLMCFVGGAHMVHGHAEGMNIELYGLGEVLGVDNGRGKYQKDIHENYSRIFSAHNTVIVNGSSQGEGGWVGLGINTVQLVSMEPKPFKEAISPYYSYTRTSFEDDKGDKAEATQERTLALIRTSPTTGYYMDVFRSDSKLSNEFHDYLYHNIGDKLEFLNGDISLETDSKRFTANANKEWRQNGRYRNPGWHFFEKVQTSQNYPFDVKARFAINKLKDNKKGYMNLFIAGNEHREYTKVMAPQTFQAPAPYDSLLTPTLVIRQKGEAWSKPFAVIYEPTFDEKFKTGIQSVTSLRQDGIFKGFKVISKIGNKLITQYIINQEEDTAYKDEKMHFTFMGAFAVLTYDETENLQNIYIGEGLSFKNNNIWIQTDDDLPLSAYIDFSKTAYYVNATKNMRIEKLKQP